MKPTTSLEDQLDALGATLRERPRLTGKVMEQVRESASELPIDAPTISEAAWATRHRWHLASAAVLMVSAALGVTLILLSSSAVSWAEVTKAINQQEWIRAQATYVDGTQGTIWLSPTHGVSAFKSSGTIRFSHAHMRAKYEYRVGSEQMTKLPLGADELERMFPMDALARNKTVLGPWLFGTEKILEQDRQVVVEDGETWVDFRLVLWRGGFDRT
ncbi:MAG TPA: hypothetical protein VNQ74_08155, partial [Burkholderiaceae bacterium]|nr:hypothetical protein [Burkholderiaceae bacterium]